MVSIRNVQKFVDDHPELFRNNKEEVLAKAKAAVNDGIISGGAVKDFMGELTALFFKEVTSSPEHLQIGLEDLAHFTSIVPKDKSYPADSVQCGHCGGSGCPTCQDKGWLTPKNHPDGRKCEREACGKPLSPNHVAIYCTVNCAQLDAT